MTYSHKSLPLIEPEYYNKLTKPEAVKLGSKIFHSQNHPSPHAGVTNSTQTIYSAPASTHTHCLMGSCKNTVSSSSQ